MASTAQALRRVREAITLRAVFGSLVIVLGVSVLFFVFLTVAIAAYYSALNGGEQEFWSTHRLIRRVALMLFPLGIIYGGLLLLESKKVSVLYLRKFRLNVNVIDPRHRSGLGRGVRLITLDDREFKSSAVPAMDIWLSRIVPAIVLAAALLFSASYAGRGPISEINEPLRYALVIAISFETKIALFVLISFILHQYVAVRRSRVSVESANELPAAIDIAQSASKWWNRPAMFGRQATTISASDAVWQSAVKSLSNSVSAVVIDVSDRSKHVDWELSYLREEGIPHVLIAEKTAAGDGSLGPDVLEYDLSDLAALGPFRHNVNEALNRIARTPDKLRPLTTEQRRPLLLKLAATYLLVFGMAALAATVLSQLSYPLFMSLLYRA